MEQENNVNQGLGIYCLLWVRLAGVSAGVWWVSTELVDVLSGVMLAVLGVTDQIAKVADVVVFDLAFWEITWTQTLKALGFVLLWWRAIKVLVLHGAPFTFGVSMAMGRQDSGINGRLVTLAHVGDDAVHGSGVHRKFWFGFVARSHPASDKLVRSRVELLSMALPWDFTFLVQEGKFFLFRQTHAERATKFRAVSDVYLKKDEKMPQDWYRKRMVNALESVKKAVSGEVSRKRIDGLSWTFAFGGGISISDDFGFKMTAVRSGDGYMVDAQPVASIDELRTLARERLNPVVNT